MVPRAEKKNEDTYKIGGESDCKAGGSTLPAQQWRFPDFIEGILFS